MSCPLWPGCNFTHRIIKSPTTGRLHQFKGVHTWSNLGGPKYLYKWWSNWPQSLQLYNGSLFQPIPSDSWKASYDLLTEERISWPGLLIILHDIDDQSESGQLQHGRPSLDICSRHWIRETIIMCWVWGNSTPHSISWIANYQIHKQILIHGFGHYLATIVGDMKETRLENPSPWHLGRTLSDRPHTMGKNIQRYLHLTYCSSQWSLKVEIFINQEDKVAHSLIYGM